MSNNNGNNNLLHFDKTEFQHDLISWFEEEMRSLPWREDRDPYKIWVSEIMLQQTRVDTVIPYFTRFIEKFPTIEALASAKEEEVLKAWEGLGYYSRVRNLQSAVKEVHEQYKGVVPNTPKEISSLKGVGPYTTGAILSIAYGIPEPAVDGNVMRVFSRICSIWEDIAKSKTRVLFEEIVREAISIENPSYFNQALMELGALICTPTSPSCLLCPVREHCKAFEEGVQAELPVKSKKKAPKPLSMVAAVLVDENEKLLVHKRPNKGLLANLWEFPNVESQPDYQSPKETLKQFLEKEYEVDVDLGGAFTTIQHVFSHIVWNITVYKGTIKTEVSEREDLKTLSLTDLNELAFPVSHQNILKAFLKD
ncbi:A/G-specific adenine glycosylase [Bacillus sp. PS06]|uniref:A/G-specific adenine glycosylase n=1 Tax=Bacillus sp. PS06 TaxID=2764176 RepID=UPI001782959F|nr:A/G-specific adenine glycosylase [Bacillus sp. PS06]MBD8071212.1 A/G-specific adenine glycosylase [Bacillus sp. PS06]